jgi:uncharacterized protein CbrC (UPF0167 family)
MVLVEGLEKVSCNSCGTTRSLVYHHVSYEPKEVVEVLCRTCHRQIHNRNNIEKPRKFISKIVKNDTSILSGVTIPQAEYDEIVSRLKPLETVQDFIRKAITEKLTKEVKE